MEIDGFRKLEDKVSKLVIGVKKLKDENKKLKLEVEELKKGSIAQDEERAEIKKKIESLIKLIDSIEKDEQND